MNSGGPADGASSDEAMHAQSAGDDRRHFESDGDDYARFRPTYPPELATWLASIAPERRRALDVGCGSGQLATLLAEHFEEVVATDVSESQVASAVPHPRVTYRVESAEEPNEPTSSFGLVTAGQAAHWFDLATFYAAAERVAVPGGAVALVGYGVVEVAGPVGDRLARFYWDETAEYWPPERRHVQTGYADIAFPFEELVMPALWIERRWSADELLGYIATWSAVRRARESGRAGLFEAFAEDVRGIGAGDDLDARFPVIGRVGLTRS